MNAFVLATPSTAVYQLYQTGDFRCSGWAIPLCLGANKMQSMLTKGTAVGCLGMLLLLGLALPARGQGSLILNGGFEAQFAGWQGTYGVYNQSASPVEGIAVGIVTDISHSSVGRCLYQQFATTPGERYAIEFGLRLPELFEIAPGNWVPVTGDSGGGSTSVEVQWDGVSLGLLPVTNRDEWAFYRLEAVATGTTSELGFFNGSSVAWPFLDGVSVTVVPEPGTLGLLLLAGAFACGVGRRGR